MVCGAPIPCSSGGRSAVSMSIGTLSRSASTTAACNCTAAVPLVVSTTAGRPVARAMPSAMNEADRSSWWTCTCTRPSSASASAIGVEREPGEMTACVSPHRTHSSTSVVQNVRLIEPMSGATGASVGADADQRPTLQPCLIPNPTPPRATHLGPVPRPMRSAFRRCIAELAPGS